MANHKFHYFIRRSHRVLGICIGIQFLAWTFGGLYFSWSDMDEVHGDYELSHENRLPEWDSLVVPTGVIDSIQFVRPWDILTGVKMINIKDHPYWQITFMDGKVEEHKDIYYLCDAITGKVRSSLSEQEAVELALNRYLGKGKVESVEHLTATSKTHEYREQSLPAYAVTFEDARHTTIYVASEAGVITKVRNRPWRQFDFLWMMHTMDYTSRDNISNLLLRIFSIFGIVTVASGITLFFVSLKQRRT